MNDGCCVMRPVSWGVLWISSALRNECVSFLRCISGGSKLDKFPSDMKKSALKCPALQLTEQTEKGQSAGLSNRCLLHLTDLSAIDSLYVKRRCWWTKRCCLRERKKVKREKKGKRGTERHKEKEESSNASSPDAALTWWTVQNTHLFPWLGSAPNLSLLRWRWSEKALEMGEAEMCFIFTVVVNKMQTHVFSWWISIEIY